MFKHLTRVLKRLAWHHKVIPDRVNPSRPYLTRHYLLGGENHRWFVLCLHEFHCSDPTDLHDHPAPYFTMVLRGGYLERTPEGTFDRRPGHFRFRRSTDLHSIQLVPGRGPVFTLFAMGPRWRDWGFATKRGWVPHDPYLDELKRRYGTAV